MEQYAFLPESRVSQQSVLPGMVLLLAHSCHPLLVVRYCVRRAACRPKYCEEKERVSRLAERKQILESP